MPLKVNTGGVIPVIFASSILAFPATIASMFQGPGRLGQRSSSARRCRSTTCCSLLGIVFFAYFYTAIIFNPG